MTLRPPERVASILRYFLFSNHSAVSKQPRILYMMCLSVVGLKQGRTGQDDVCGGSSSPPPVGMQPTHNVRPWQVLVMLNAVFTHHITKQWLPSSTTAQYSS